MATSSSNLKTQNSNITLSLDSNRAQRIGIFINGTGTVILEVSGDNGVGYVQLTLFNPKAGVNAAAQTLVAAANAQYAYADVAGVGTAKVTRTDAGGQDLTVVLGAGAL
jgi:hypothetical protein